MIANALRAEIDRYASRMRRSNPMFYKAEDGTLTVAHVATYLTNVHHLVCHTPIFLVRARDRARQLGDAALAEHYEKKRGEEQGHDEWAERDMARVSTLPKPGSPQILPTMHDLLDYLRNTIDRDPTLYLAYILFAEYFTVLVGDGWLRSLEENCGIPRTFVSVVDNHVELDKEHVECALDEIDDLVGDPRKLPEMRKVLTDTFTYFGRFCVDFTQDAPSRSWSSANATSAA